MVSFGLTEILAQSVMPQLSLVIMSQHSHRQRVLFFFLTKESPPSGPRYGKVGYVFRFS